MNSAKLKNFQQNVTGQDKGPKATDMRSIPGNNSGRTPYGDDHSP